MHHRFHVIQYRIKTNISSLTVSDTWAPGWRLFSRPRGPEKKNLPDCSPKKNKLNTWTHTVQVSRNRLSRTDPRGHSSRVFFRYVKRARTARHRSFNETEVSSPASPRSRYFPHSYPHHLRLSRRQPYPPFRRRSPAAGSVSRKRSELAILFTLEVTPLYRVSIGFNPVDAPRSIRYSRLSSLQLSTTFSSTISLLLTYAR